MIPQFSICIPSYQRADLLDFCLERLQPLEKCNKPFEIVVSDNASTDHTGDVVRKRQKSMPYLRYVRQDENVGMWKNWKSALWNARSPIILYLGDDDSIICENVIPHVERLQKEPDLVGIYTDSIAWDDEQEIELHRYYRLERPYSFAPEDPLGLVNFLFQRIIYPELGVFRRDTFLRSITEFKHAMPPFHLWMYRHSRLGRVAFDMHAFYRETRVLKNRLTRGHWGNMDMSLVYIDDHLRITLESTLLMALQDAGMTHVPDDQQFKIRQMVERFLHGRTTLEIQRAIAARNWILAMELRRRLALWYGPGDRNEQQRDVMQITYPAVIQSIQETLQGLSGVNGIEFRGFQSRQVQDFFRSVYPETPIFDQGQSPSGDRRPLIVYRDEATGLPLSQSQHPFGYTLYFDRLLANYAIGSAKIETSSL